MAFRWKPARSAQMSLLSFARNCSIGVMLMASSCRHSLPSIDPIPLPSSRIPPAASGPSAAVELYDSAKGIVTEEDVAMLRLRMLAVPVLGRYPADVPTTFTDGRSGGRRHNAVDILAPRGTPVLSADDGVILRLSSNTLGGITVYATDPERRFVYYYAHLDAYAPGLRVDQRVRRGEVLGYVGTTGNAPKNTPHLHFQITRVLDRDRLWDGVPIDPKPFFQLPGALP
jgi:peptidoglycan LD-endopeptidase LytH